MLPAATTEPREDVVARLPALPRDDPDRAGKPRSAQLFLRLEQALGGEPAAQPLERD